MGKIQKLNRLAVVCLFALAAALVSATTPLMASSLALGDPAQAATNAQTQNAPPDQKIQNGQSQPPGENQAQDKKEGVSGDPEAPAKDQAQGSNAASDTNAAPAAAPPYKRDFSDRNARIGDEGPMFGGAFWHRILRDEKTIWLSPFHLHGSDALWVAPIVGGTAALMPFDTRINKSLENSSSQLSIASHVSQMGAPYTVAGIAAGTLLLGKLTDNPKTKETGMMLTEALIHSEIVMNVLKAGTGRMRPMLTDGTMTSGSFGHLTADGSFPSGHSMSAWALASVFAHQYSDQKWVPFLSYGLASAVSLSRIAGQKHYPSDVLFGSALGYLMGRFVYRQHMAALYKQEPKWKKVLPDVSPAIAHGGIGISLNWNLDKKN